MYGLVSPSAVSSVFLPHVYLQQTKYVLLDENILQELRTYTPDIKFNHFRAWLF